MYFSDHGPPHFHAVYGDLEFKIRIDLPGLMRGDPPPRVLAMVIEWATLHQKELLENWQRLREQGRVLPIPPLE